MKYIISMYSLQVDQEELIGISGGEDKVLNVEDFDDLKSTTDYFTDILFPSCKLVIKQYYTQNTVPLFLVWFLLYGL